MIEHLYNFRTNKVDEVELDYLPIFIESVRERFLEHVEIGTTPADALKMTTDELWLAFKDTMDTVVESIRQDAVKKRGENRPSI